MIANDVISRVRSNLQDSEVGNLRWSDTELLNYLNDGIRELKSRRPDLCYDGATGEFPDFTDLSLGGGGALPTTVLKVDEMARALLVNYVSYRAFLRDGADEYNAKRASEFVTLYEKGLING